MAGRQSCGGSGRQGVRLVAGGPGGLARLLSVIHVDEESASLPAFHLGGGVLLRKSPCLAVESKSLEKHGLLEVLRNFNEEEVVE